MATSRGRKSKKASEPVVEEQSVEVPEEAPAEPVDSEPEPVAVKPEPASQPEVQASEPEPEVVSAPETVVTSIVEQQPVQQSQDLAIGVKVITPTGKLCVVESFDHKGRCIVRNLKRTRHSYSFKDHSRLRLLK